MLLTAGTQLGQLNQDCRQLVTQLGDLSNGGQSNFKASEVALVKRHGCL
jgi:hypothetical protein